MKATLLEQMKRDYIHIKHTKMVTREQVERQEEVRHSSHKPLNVDVAHQARLYSKYTLEKCYLHCLFLVKH